MYLARLELNLTVEAIAIVPALLREGQSGEQEKFDIWCGLGTGIVVVYDLVSRAELASLRVFECRLTTLAAIPSAAGWRVWAGSTEGHLAVIDCATRRQCELLRWHRNVITAIAPAGPRVVSCSVNGHVAVWDAESLRLSAQDIQIEPEHRAAGCCALLVLGHQLWCGAGSALAIVDTNQRTVALCQAPDRVAARGPLPELVSRRLPPPLAVGAEAEGADAVADWLQSVGAASRPRSISRLDIADHIAMTELSGTRLRAAEALSVTPSMFGTSPLSAAPARSALSPAPGPGRQGAAAAAGTEDDFVLVSGSPQHLASVSPATVAASSSAAMPALQPLYVTSPLPAVAASPGASVARLPYAPPRTPRRHFGLPPAGFVPGGALDVGADGESREPSGENGNAGGEGIAVGLRGEDDGQESASFVSGAEGHDSRTSNDTHAVGEVEGRASPNICASAASADDVGAGPGLDAAVSSAVGRDNNATPAPAPDVVSAVVDGGLFSPTTPAAQPPAAAVSVASREFARTASAARLSLGFAPPAVTPNAAPALLLSQPSSPLHLSTTRTPTTVSPSPLVAVANPPPPSTAAPATRAAGPAPPPGKGLCAAHCSAVADNLKDGASGADAFVATAIAAGCPGEVWVASALSAHVQVWRAADVAVLHDFTVEATGIAALIHHQNTIWAGSNGFRTTRTGASRAGAIYVWDAYTHAPLRELRCHTDLVRSLASHRQLVLSGSSSGDGTVVFWSTDRPTIPLCDGGAMLNLVLDDGTHDSHGFSRKDDTMIRGITFEGYEGLCFDDVVISGFQSAVNAKAWEEYLARHGPLCADSLGHADFQTLLRLGLPAPLRRIAWMLFIQSHKGATMRFKKGCYQETLRQKAGRQSEYVSLIEMDLLRTFPFNKLFRDQHSEAIMRLRHVLVAYSWMHPVVGYCQGFNKIVAFALLYLDEEEDAFWLLVTVVDMLGADYYTFPMAGLQRDLAILKALVAKHFPRLAGKLDLAYDSYFLNWFMVLTVRCLPSEATVRILDLFLLQGRPVLFRFVVALLLMHEDELALRQDAIEPPLVKRIFRRTRDIDELARMAYAPVDQRLGRRLEDELELLRPK